jgi:membrane-associated phospholipid phosphatase
LIYKYYLAISLALLVSFIVLAVIISPRISDNDGGIFPGIIKGDEITYLQVNNPHFDPLNEIMILFSQYGRGVAWTLTGVLLFVFGGWIGRKTAIVMAITMLILIPIGTIAKETIGRLRPAMPEAELLMTLDTGYSFPSGHAVIVSSGAAIMLTLYRASYKKTGSFYRASSRGYASMLLEGVCRRPLPARYSWWHIPRCGSCFHFYLDNQTC